MKAIIGGKIILKDEIIENSALLYSDVIEGIVPTENVPEDTEIIGAYGKYVDPGLIDLHIHGYLGKDVCDDAYLKEIIKIYDDSVEKIYMGTK